MDCRDWAREKGKWYDSFDEENMTVTITFPYESEDDEDESDEMTVEFPVTFVVCDLCDGKGRHVNPSVDAHGISAYEFDEDPGFKEDYFSGKYDVSCYQCGGKRVVPEIDSTCLTEEQKAALKAFREYQDEEDAYLAEVAAERRFGC